MGSFSHFLSSLYLFNSYGHLAMTLYTSACSEKIIILRDNSLTYGQGDVFTTFFSPDEFYKALHPKRKYLTKLVMDTSFFNYCYDQLPAASRLDRHRVSRRRLEKHASKAFLKGIAHYASRQIGLISYSLPDASHTDWFTVFAKLGLPLRLITALPIELTYLSKSRDDLWELFVYQNQDQQIRHNLVYQKRLIFTRLTTSPATFTDDIESTLKYCQRFDLHPKAGKIVILGKIELDLPSQILTLSVENIYAEETFEQVYIKQILNKAKTIGALELKPNPFRSFYFKAKLPIWLKRTSLGYASIALLLSVFLYVSGLTVEKEIDLLKSQTAQANNQLSYYEKTHKEAVDKVVHIHAYEKAWLRYEDPLETFEKLALHKPPSLIISKMEWEKNKEDPSRLSFRIISPSEDNPQLLQDSLKTFLNALKRVFPVQLVEKQKEAASHTLIIAENKNLEEAKNSPEFCETIRITRMKS